MRHTRTWGLAGAVAGMLAMGGVVSLRSLSPAGPAAPAERPVSELIEALADSAPEPRRAAAEALLRLGPAAAPALHALLAALDDPDTLARAQTVVALGRLGSVAVEPLAAVLDSPRVLVRRGAAAALG